MEKVEWIEMDPEAVRGEIETRVANEIRQRDTLLLAAPDEHGNYGMGFKSLPTLLRFYENNVRESRLRYACVRIKAVSAPGVRTRYYLNYNASVDYPPHDGHGTGPYPTAFAAAASFYTGGR